MQRCKIALAGIELVMARQAQVSSWQDAALRVTVREDDCWIGSNKSSSRARIDVRLQRKN